LVFRIELFDFMKSTSEEEIQYTELSELGKVAEKVIAFAGDTRVWAFEGEMGAGKTTLIKAICRCFQVEDNVTSPTFSLVNEYKSVDQQVFYHFDFYRLKDEYEAMDIGVEEYFYSGNYCFLEWPSKILSLLPSEVIEVNIIVKDNSRTIKLFKNRTPVN
jgi:tRNA threonylcarbamoyladenosine biosynthesis protein TsaE